MDYRVVLILAFIASVLSTEDASIRRMDIDPLQPGPDEVQWRLCPDEIPRFQSPCLCTRITTRGVQVGTDGTLILNDTNPSGSPYLVDCDGVSLPDNLPVLPLKVTVAGYSHRHGGFQTFPRQLFTANDVPLAWVDFRHNHLQRLSDRFLDSVRNTLQELYLGYNCLGHQLNPVFATDAFNSLTELKILDLGYNRLKDLDDALFLGLDNLEELRLDGNDIEVVPTRKLQHLPKLTRLSLQHNYIDQLKSGDFSMATKLEYLNLSSNGISTIGDGAFTGLKHLTHLDLSRNQIRSLDNDKILSNLENLKTLDLSANFLGQVPSRALRSLRSLTDLRLASNAISELRLDDFAELPSLETLDLSRNRITELPPTVFSRLVNLQRLVLDVNLVRKIEEPAFHGLANLRHLSVNDNNILGLPGPALASVPSLRRLDVGYNRIAAISPDLLRTVRNLQELDLCFNLIREIPVATFHNFTELARLNLRGNQLGSSLPVTSLLTFAGVETTLQYLDLSANMIDTFPPLPQFSSLETLDLSNNRITSLPETALESLPAIRTLNLNHNRLVELAQVSFSPDHALLLEHLTLRANRLKVIRKDTFTQLRALQILDLADNDLHEIEEGTFRNLPDLRRLDLSINAINTVRPKAFGLEMLSLRHLNLSGNELTVLDGGMFETRVSTMRVLDVSANHIHYLIPGALAPLPHLTSLNLRNNRLTLFLEGLLNDVPYLERLQLASNHLHQIDGQQLSHARRLRHLDLSSNGIDVIGDRAFYNSTQIRRLNLSRNRLTALPEGVFDGLARLELDLSDNNMTELPAGIFARHRVANLQSIDLSSNQFKRLPLAALNDQYATLEDLLAADNDVSHIPANANSLVNVRRLDLSNNPLDQTSIETIFGEPKTVQELKLSGCGIKELPRLETPFLLSLDLSGNGLTSLGLDVFQRTTLLESLDVSHNDIRNLSSQLSTVWSKIAALQHLNLSGNPLKELGPRHLSALKHLETLSLNDLHDLGRIDDDALAGLSSLRRLSIHGYPRLGYYDVGGVLERVPSLESLDVEIKVAVLRDQLHPAYSARLSTLIVQGRQLQNLTSVALAGLLSPRMDIGIHGTSVSTIPNTILLPLPHSADITLDVSDNRVTALGPQLTMTLNEKRHQVRLVGLAASNPLYCDCNIKHMLQWMADRIDDGENEWKRLKCFGPDELAMRSIWRLADDDLTCVRPTTTLAPSPPPPPPLQLDSVDPTTTSSDAAAASASKASSVPDIFGVRSKDEYIEPDIIYEAPTPRPQHPSDDGFKSSLTNMDSMVIGIIVGVVTFICILIIIICIVKLHQSRMRYARSSHMMHFPPMYGNGNGPCTCVKQSPGGSFQNVPLHQGTLPPKMSGNGSVKSQSRSVVGRHHHRPNNHQAYYVSYSENDIIEDR